ncbi:MAG: metal ABC transporter ATP-binding protein [Clostridiaceae bacterium]|nr:metal ABC transporter ATP-binding protein [Clostridiaceae bacterium]
MDKILEVKNLNFSYNKVQIFENVSFDIYKGDYFGIVGPNGAGKSTFIKLALNFLTPLRGEVKIAGYNVHNFPDWSTVGYVPQNTNSFNMSFPATVEEVIASNIYKKRGFYYRLNYRLKEKKKIQRDKVHDVLKIVDMEEYADKLIGNLSGGQLQRVFIARMLVNNPGIVFLDEPTKGIDAKSEEAMYCILAKLNKEFGMTIIMVSHDIAAIKAHANKIGIAGNKNIKVINPEEVTDELLSDLYGYKINLNLYRHECLNCCDNNMENIRGKK